MFNYTNTILLNSNLDSSGKAKWSAVAGVGPDPGPEVIATLDVKRFMKFYAPNVVSIYKREGYNPELGNVTLGTLQLSENGSVEGQYRIKMYIRLSNSNNNSLYSNDMVYKGKPLYLEYYVAAGETAAQTATKVAALARQIQQGYDFHYLDYSASGSTLTIDATDEYQVFKSVEVQKFYPSDCSPCNEGRFETIATARVADDPEYDSVNTIVQGLPGFGTYYQITKDLRLPTGENRRWAGLNQEEMPIPGALYNQYTIHYRKNRGQVGGGGGVGEEVVSLTTHVFFVLSTLATQFETALAEIGTIEDAPSPN